MSELFSVILAIVAQATPQAPMLDIAIIDLLIAQPHGARQGDVLRALDQAVADRLLSTARVTKHGLTNDVYWPTGLKTPALKGNQPMEPIIVPTASQTDTHVSRLIKHIVAHGPLIAADLAEKAGVIAKNIDPLLASAIKNGTIHTRTGYMPELGRERKHYMTATQAQEWDERGQPIEVGPAEEPAPVVPGGHVMSHPAAVEAAASVALDGDTHYADDATLERLAVLEREHQEFFDNWHDQRRRAEALDTQIHGLKNDVAARDLILHALADKLQVDEIEAIPAALDDLTHALATRAMTGAAPAGRMALLLIDSAEITDLEELDKHDAPNAQDLAVRSIEQGHAARALVVRIVGEATRRVEWKEAA